jgi:hypothetical protein
MLNFEQKMKSHDTMQATNATARAIAKATETINQANLQNVHQDLRISNLEKANKQHEQKTLKEIKIFKKKLQGKPTTRVFGRSNKTDSEQKQTSTGTQNSGPYTRQHRKRKSGSANIRHSPILPNNKKKTHIQGIQTSKKSVHWQNAKILNYHLHHPVTSTFPPQNNQQNLHPQDFAKTTANFPSNMFLSILEVVMKNNIFSFANTFWQQLSGTAMGTPVACNYATVTYGHFENTVILPRFKNNLYYYRPYIDDIFGIWVPPPTNQRATWANFKNTLSQWGSLEWLAEEPSKKKTFLTSPFNYRETKSQPPLTRRS